MKKLPIGELINGSRFGASIGMLIQKMAIAWGWDADNLVVDMLSKRYEEATENAMDYLDLFVPDGYWVGFVGGNFGVWPETTDADFKKTLAEVNIFDMLDKAHTLSSGLYCALCLSPLIKTTYHNLKGFPTCWHCLGKLN